MKIQILTAAAAAVCISTLASCASLSSAGGIADRRNSAPVSDAEYKQTMKQQHMERNEVRLEREKRDNAVDTVWDVDSTIRGVRSIGRGIGL